jgi:type IV pilus assembly protein PilQ
MSLISILACATNQPVLQTPQPGAPPKIASASVLENITYSEEGGYTRIRLEGSEPITPPVYQLLSDPSRLVIDLPNVDMKKVKEPIRIDNGTIGEVWVTQFDDKGRIEVYLTQPANYNISKEDRVLNIDIEQVKKLAEVKEEKTENAPVQDKETEVTPVEVKTEAPPSAVPPQVPSPPESAAQETKAKEITDITLEKKDDSVRFHILADGKLGNYDSFKLDSPPRLVIDLWDVNATSLKKRIKLPNPFIKEIRVGQYSDKLRLVFDGSKSQWPPYQIDRSGDQLVLILGSVLQPPGPQIALEEKSGTGGHTGETKGGETAKPEEKKIPGPGRPANAGKSTLLGIDFKVVDNRSRVVVTASEEPQIESSRISNKILVVDLKNMNVPKYLQRGLDTSEFKSAVQSIGLQNIKKGKSNEVRILIKLKEEVPYETTREGKYLFIDIENPRIPEPKEVAAPIVAKEETLPKEAAKEEVKKEESKKEEPRREGVNNEEVRKEEVKKEEIKKEAEKPAAEAKKPIQEPPGVITKAGTQAPVEKRVEAKSAAGEEGPQGKMFKGPKISLDFKDADIKNILRLIAEVSNFNIIAGDDVTGKVTMRLVDVPWDQALDVILSARNLGKTEIGNVIRIAPIETLKREEQSTLEAKRSKERLEDLTTEVIPLNYVTAKEITAQVKSILSDRGDVRVIEQTNALLVKDIPKKIDEVKRILKEVDARTQQVIIEARIVEANMTFQRELGVSWGLQLQAGKLTNSQTTLQGGLTGNKVVDMPALPAIGTAGIIDFLFTSVHALRQLDIQISAHEADGSVKIISSPKIATLHNKEASIEQGLRIPYLKLTTEGTVTTDFIEANLKLTVVPHITSDGHVKMYLKVRKDAPDPTITVQGVPSIDKKEAITEVLVQDNGMVVIGGIYTINKSSNLEGIPLFSKIPLLGWLFKRSTKDDERKDLMIFISPRIVKESL